MGLDITVRVNPEDVLGDLEYNKDIALKDVAKELLRARTGQKDVHARPGSYSGLHRLRAAVFPEYAETMRKGIGEWPKLLQESHLCNHSDCDGWYLPEDFGCPTWLSDCSIGSSVMLLRELQNKPMPNMREWQELYVAAVASVVADVPIKFH